MTDGTENVKRLRALGNRRGGADRMEMRMEHPEKETCRTHLAYGHQSNCAWCRKAAKDRRGK